MSPEISPVTPTINQNGDVESPDAEIPSRRPPATVRAIREIAFIVVGVLIALGVNSWWENRRERAQELVNLRILLDATVANQQRVADAIGLDSISHDHMGRVLTFVRTSGVPLPDSMEVMAWRGMWFSDFHPLTGAYNAVASGGGLALLRNDQLRAQIVEIGGELAGAEQQIRTYDDQAMDNGRQLGPFFDVVGASTRIGGGEFFYGQAFPPTPLPGSRQTWAIRQASPDFETALFGLWSNSGDRLSILRSVREDLSILRLDLEGELSSRGG
mgnify:CR=1 FL=1